jgi:hypothetical protein
LSAVLRGDLDPDVDSALVAPSPAEPEAGEAFGLWSYDPASGVGVHLWMGNAPAQQMVSERVLLYLPDGRIAVYRANGGFRTTEAGPAGDHITYTIDEPFGRWTYRYVGETPVTPALPEQMETLDASGPPIDVAVDLVGTMLAPPWVQGALLPEPADAMQHEAGRFIGGFRYEQLVGAVGTITADGRTFDFHGYGLRTHQRGVRQMAGMAGHTWISGWFPASARGFGIQLYPRPAGDGHYMTEGMVVVDGVMHGARVVDSPELRLSPEDDRYDVVLEIPGGARHTISGRTHKTHFTGAPGVFVMAHACATFEWDGVEGWGMDERSGGTL